MDWAREASQIRFDSSISEPSASNCSSAPASFASSFPNCCSWVGVGAGMKGAELPNLKARPRSGTLLK